jgi:hypothetical protein
LGNLIANAIKFTESGTVTISANLAGIKKQTHRNGKSDSIVSAPGCQRSIEFRVSDTGIGMAKEDRSSSSMDSNKAIARARGFIAASAWASTLSEDTATCSTAPSKSRARQVEARLLL